MRPPEEDRRENVEPLLNCKNMVSKRTLDFIAFVSTLISLGYYCHTSILNQISSILLVINIIVLVCILYNKINHQFTMILCPIIYFLQLEIQIIMLYYNITCTYMVLSIPGILLHLFVSFLYIVRVVLVLMK